MTSSTKWNIIKKY